MFVVVVVVVVVFVVFNHVQLNQNFDKTFCLLTLNLIYLSTVLL